MSSKTNTSCRCRGPEGTLRRGWKGDGHKAQATQLPLDETAPERPYLDPGGSNLGSHPGLLSSLIATSPSAGEPAGRGRLPRPCRSLWLLPAGWSLPPPPLSLRACVRVCVHTFMLGLSCTHLQGLKTPIKVFVSSLGGS